MDDDEEKKKPMPLPIKHQVFYLHPLPRNKCDRKKRKQSEKIRMLLYLLKDVDDQAVILFTNTIGAAKSVETALEKAGHRPGTLHRGKSRKEREVVLEGFVMGTYNVLISTDIKVDMPDSSHVINYDVVEDVEKFKRRLELACRSGNKGVVTTLLSESDKECSSSGVRWEVLRYLKEVLVESNLPVPDELWWL